MGLQQRESVLEENILLLIVLMNFTFKKNLKLEEQRAIDQFHLSSPKRLLLDYCNNGSCS